jgi:hypothetical protein
MILLNLIDIYGTFKAKKGATIGIDPIVKNILI